MGVYMMRGLWFHFGLELTRNIVASYAGQIGLCRRNPTWQSPESWQDLSCACHCLTREDECQAVEDMRARSHYGWKTMPVRVRLHHLQRLRTDGVRLKQNLFVIILFHLFLSMSVNKPSLWEMALKFQGKKKAKNHKFTPATVAPWAWG